MQGKGWAVGAAMAACAMLTGCWDRVEIDQRGFVVGVAIDKPTTGKEAHDGHSADRYRVTYQIVIPSAMKQSSGKSGGAGSGSGSGSGKAYFNITAQERSLSALTAKMSLRTSRQPFMEHLKTIVVSSEMANAEGLGDMFDYFLRDKDMRRSAHVLISSDEAKPMLELEVPNEPLPALYLNAFDRNRSASSYIAPQIRIGDVHEKLLRYETFVIPRVTYKNKQVAAFDSVAIIDGRTNRMVGELNEQEAQALNFLRGNVVGGALEFKMEGIPATYALDKGRSEFKLIAADSGHLTFAIRIHVEGTLNETGAPEDYTATGTLRKAENAVAAEIKERCDETIRFLQKELKKDAIGLERYLYENHYREWNRIKGDWDHGKNLFSVATIRVEPSASIRRSGNIDQVRGR